MMVILTINGCTPDQAGDLVKTHIRNHCQDLRRDMMKQADLQTTIKHRRYYEGRASSYAGLIAYIDDLFVKPAA